MFDLDSNCPLHTNCDNSVGPTGPMKSPIMIVGEYPSDEDELMRAPLMGRDGMLIRSLLNKAGIDANDCRLTMACLCKEGLNEPVTMDLWRNHLWGQIEKDAPKVVITLGKLPTHMLLQGKKSFRLSDYVGMFFVRDWLDPIAIAPWFSPAHCLKQGKKFDQSTVEFFTSIKEGLTDGFVLSYGLGRDKGVKSRVGGNKGRT